MFRHPRKPKYTPDPSKEKSNKPVPLTTGAVCNQIEHLGMAQDENRVYGNKDKNVHQWPEISNESEAISF